MKRASWLGLLAVALGVGFWVSAGRQDDAVPAAPVAPTARPAQAPEVSDAPGGAALQGPAARQAAPAAEAPDPAVPASEPYRLLVSTRTATGNRGKPVLHVPVEVGCGRTAGPQARVLARGTSDAAGDLELLLPREEVDAVGGRLWVRSAGAGWIQRSRAVPPGQIEKGEPVVLVAFPGCTVTGRLLDAQGAPVRGQVRAGPLMPGTGELGFGGMAQAQADGWFELHLFHPDPIHLVADAGDAGGAALRDFQPACTWPPERVELVVRGPGVVRGRVSGAAGEPASQLDLLVLPAELDDERGSLVLPEPRATALALEGRGRTWAEARADEQGTFEVRGLTSEPYVVRARTESGGGYPHQLTPRPVPPDGAPLELRFGRPHLVVRAVDVQGAPVAAEVRAENPLTSMHAWPERLRFVVAPAADEAAPSGGARLAGKAGPDGTGIYELEEGRSYDVGLLGPGQPWSPRTVHVPPGAGRVEVELRTEELPAGELVLSVAEAAGAAGDRDVALRLSDPRSDVPLIVRESFYRPTWPLRISLPAGSYRLVVEGHAFVDTHHGTILRPRSHGRFEELVEVLPGREARVLAVLPAGARLHVRLVGEVQEHDHQALRAQYTGLETSVWPPRACLALRAPGRWPFPVDFAEPMSRGSRGTWELPLPSERSSELLPAGRFTLEARMPGGRVATAPVVLADGETTEATLTFE